MNPKTALAISINQADSLKKMTQMSGWKIIEGFLNEAEEECQAKLDDEANKDIADIQASRKIKKFIHDFRELFIDTELSAGNDQRELKILKEGKE